MAIGDLLWACPFCGDVGSIRADGGSSACSACGAAFRRGDGAEVVATRPGAAPVARSAAAWLRELPSVERAFDGGARPGAALREDRVELTVAGPDEEVRRAGEVLGFRETPGTTTTGVLRLDGERVSFAGEDGSVRSWALDDLTAIQSSSRVVQIKQRDRPVVTFRFQSGSPRLWEELLQHAVRSLYRRAGRGEIREFQPRIVVR